MTRELPHSLTRRPRVHGYRQSVHGLAIGILLALSWPGTASRAQDFQIVWVVIGEAAASAGDQPVNAGRHLFMATELAAFSLRRITVARIDAEPVITNLAVGERFCLTSLKITASEPDRSIVKRAPLTISIRQDHKDALHLERRKDNICVRPTIPGEFPIRFTSLLPAADGSTRGAQIFVRVHDAAGEAAGESEATDAAPAPGQHRFVVW